MDLEYKFREFVSDLSDEEITNQLNDILEWAKVYKRALEDEKRKRLRNGLGSIALQETKIDYQSNYSEDDFYETMTDQDSDSLEDSFALDYYTIQAINRKVESMNEEELETNLSRLKSISKDDLTVEQAAQLQFEIEACELHLISIKGTNEGVICPLCGKELPYGAAFCTKCGAKL